jgi:hypothetical protein
MKGSADVINDAAPMQPPRWRPVRPVHSERTPVAFVGRRFGGSSRKYRYQHGRTNAAIARAQRTRADVIALRCRFVASRPEIDNQ